VGTSYNPFPPNCVPFKPRRTERLAMWARVPQTDCRRGMNTLTMVEIRLRTVLKSQIGQEHGGHSGGQTPLGGLRRQPELLLVYKLDIKYDTNPGGYLVAQTPDSHISTQVAP